MNRGLKVEIEITGGAVPIRLRDCVTRYEVRSAISELSEVILELSLKNPAFDVREVVGHPIKVELGEEPYLRRLDGMTSRMRQLSSLAEGISRYEIVVVPKLWLTTRRRDHRIFQDQSVTEIAASVLAKYGARIAPLSNACAPHVPREYCVQYGETDFDFLSRVLADEGVAFYFDHHQHLSWMGAEPGGSALVLTDDTATVPAVEHPVPYVPPEGALIAKGPHVSSVLVSSGIETSVTTLRDYDFERPAFDFEAKAEVRDGLFDEEAELEAYTYEVGQFASSEDRGRAVQLLEEARRSREVYLLGASFALAAGTRFALTGHPVEHVNREHLVVASRSRVSVNEDGGAIVHHSHETIPATSKYRPPRRPKPRIHGTQTAFVVGKQQGADEIDVDKYGRVKVRFTWDRRATSIEGKPTRFIRVSQAWAGQGYGMVMLPRVGDELVVSYLDGDPDEPIAVGRVHNAVYPSPLKLPDTDDTTVSVWKSRSSPRDKTSSEERYNMVRMQDKAGEEVLELRAQRDFRQETLHDATEQVGHNKSVRVKGAASTSAGSISLSAGSTLTASAGTDMTLTAKGTLKEVATTVLINGKGLTSVHGKGALYLHSNGAVSITANGSITVKAPQVTVEGTGQVDVNGGVVNLNCGGK